MCGRDKHRIDIPPPGHSAGKSTAACRARFMVDESQSQVIADLLVHLDGARLRTLHHGSRSAYAGGTVPLPFREICCASALVIFTILLQVPQCASALSEHRFTSTVLISV